MLKFKCVLLDPQLGFEIALNYDKSFLSITQIIYNMKDKDTKCVIAILKTMPYCDNIGYLTSPCTDKIRTKAKLVINRSLRTAFHSHFGPGLGGCVRTGVAVLSIGLVQGPIGFSVTVESH